MEIEISPRGDSERQAFLISDCCFSIEKIIVLEKVQPWLNEYQIEPSWLTKFSKALSAHMNGEGLLGKASPPMIDAIVKHDMRNLILEQYHILAV